MEKLSCELLRLGDLGGGPLFGLAVVGRPLPQFGQEETPHREQNNCCKKNVGKGSAVDVITKRVLDRPIPMHASA
jgi:hypothetical protein